MVFDDNCYIDHLSLKFNMFPGLHDLLYRMVYWMLLTNLSVLLFSYLVFYEIRLYGFYSF